MNHAEKLGTVLALVDSADLPTVIPQGPEKFAPPRSRPPKITPEGMMAEFEANAQYCEAIAADLEIKMTNEVQQWRKLAENYRRVGKTEAENIQLLLGNLSDMRDARTPHDKLVLKIEGDKQEQKP